MNLRSVAFSLLFGLLSTQVSPPNAVAKTGGKAHTDPCAAGVTRCSQLGEGNSSCGCMKGFRLKPDGYSCEDIECAAGTHNCSTTQSCFNIQGGFRCLKFDCPPNSRHAAESRCERLPCGKNRKCHLLPLSISFYNLTFPTNIPLPAAVFHMRVSSSVPGVKVQFSIVDGNVDGYFSIRKKTHRAMVFLQKLVPEPLDFLLTVEIRLIRYGTVSTFLAKLAVFVVNNHNNLSES